MGMQNEEDDSIEIDLVELFLAVKQHILSIIIASLIGGGIALALAMFVISPVYTSTGSMLVLTKETTLASLADIQMGSQLTNDYQVLIKSRPVLETVIFDLNLDMTYQDLEETITINNPNNTRIIELSVDNQDPVLAMDIENDLARVSSEYIGDKMEVVPPKIIEEGIVPLERTSPSYFKYLVVGLMLGFLLSAGIVCLFSVLDDSIKSEEDIRKYLELPTLARVPDRKDFINQRKSGQKAKKSILDRFKKEKGHAAG